MDSLCGDRCDRRRDDRAVHARLSLTVSESDHGQRRPGRAAQERRVAGRRPARVLLVTVVKTWGSSPRPEGAMLAVRDDGLVVGSVSGGCIEDDIVDRTRREGQRATKCEVVTYGVSADEARRFGLPCGGTIQLVLEPLTRESGMRALLREIGDRPSRRAPLDVATGICDVASCAADRWSRRSTARCCGRSTDRATGCSSSARRSFRSISRRSPSASTTT